MDKKAFPVPYYRASQGMDLRDYFAAKAMQGLLSAEAVVIWDSDGFSVGSNIQNTQIEKMVTLAHKIADQMLVEREKKNGD